MYVQISCKESCTSRSLARKISLLLTVPFYSALLLTDVISLKFHWFLNSNTITIVSFHSCVLSSQVSRCKFQITTISLMCIFIAFSETLMKCHVFFPIAITFCSIGYLPFFCFCFWYQSVIGIRTRTHISINVNITTLYTNPLDELTYISTTAGQPHYPTDIILTTSSWYFYFYYTGIGSTIMIMRWFRECLFIQVQSCNAILTVNNNNHKLGPVETGEAVSRMQKAVTLRRNRNRVALGWASTNPLPPRYRRWNITFTHS